MKESEANVLNKKSVVSFIDTIKEKWSEKWSENFDIKLAENQIKILILIHKNKYITRKEISEQLNINQSAVQKHINKLKTLNLIKRIGPDKGGYWLIIDKKQ